MQDQYFELWQGIWASAIDWTAAVMGKHLSAALSTFSDSHESGDTIDRFFSQLTAFYFGQDAFALRQQAFDDRLWVVLSWLESIQFIRARASRFAGDERWYGVQWISAFAHRARLFWDLASKGWETKLCNGGMLWSPYGAPYKNAITNELFIAASISMYLHFPGDDNDSPFLKINGPQLRNMKYLAAAIEGYRWLYNINMTNSKGLYIDGFHISHWTDEGYNDEPYANMTCDGRNEMIYTYNQAVILTGQRGLYEATGMRSYLEDGHQLIEAVIAATGYNLISDSPPPPPQYVNTTKLELGKWQGMGRSGILEEYCDSRASCSQNAQTFKGIFFHHLTAFCSRLPDQLIVRERDREASAIGCGKIRQRHAERCERYRRWVKYNAYAAMRTRDGQGKFGMWWGAPPDLGPDPDLSAVENAELPEGAVDYRNVGSPRDGDKALNRIKAFASRDVNDRGRGRTVETQGGGIAVLRALWAFENSVKV